MDNEKKNNMTLAAQSEKHFAGHCVAIANGAAVLCITLTV